MHHVAFTKNSMSANLKSRNHPLRGAGAFAAVSIRSVKRLVCLFLIVWLALLSGGAYAHAATDAAKELSHIVAHATEVQLAVADGTDARSAADGGHGHSETCSQSHCGHSHTTGMLTMADLRFSDAVAGAVRPSPKFWVSHEHPNSIERPKWSTTTSLVVNL